MIEDGRGNVDRQSRPSRGLGRHDTILTRHADRRDLGRSDRGKGKEIQKNIQDMMIIDKDNT